VRDNLEFTDLADVEKLIELGQPFMQQNVADVMSAISEYPWLNRVEVRKRWPKQLLIKIIEYQSVAYWNQYQLLDVDGFSFRVPTDKMPLQKNLVALFGPDGSQQTVLKRYYQIKGVIDSLMSSSDHQFYINELILGQNLDWSLKINQHISVLLGREAIIQRIERLIELYPVLFEKHGSHLDTIDLRYESGAAIRLK
jgi:cell division protein FtsQ